MTSENDNSNAKPAWITPIESRKERAEYYFQTVLDGQQKWYSNGRDRSSAPIYAAIAQGVVSSLSRWG